MHTFVSYNIKMVRKRINTIHRLQTGNGQWVETEEQVRKILMDYFKDIYTSRGAQNLQEVTDLIRPRVTEEMNQTLMRQ